MTASSFSSNNMKSDIPGLGNMLGTQRSLPNGIILLTGPAGSGKTMYCRQFLSDGLTQNDYCLFITSNPINEEAARVRFFSIPLKDQSNNLLKIISLNSESVSSDSRTRKKMAPQLTSIVKELDGAMKSAVKRRNNNENLRIRVVVDSITHLIVLYGEDSVLQFVNKLSELIKDVTRITVMCVLSHTEQSLIDKLNSISVGMLEIKLEETKGVMTRGIRLFSIKGFYHKPTWVNFAITDTGGLSFGEESHPEIAMSCTLCGKPISGMPFTELDFVFDTKICLETYRKLNSALGTSISDTGLPSQAINVAFFYVDIVGSSDPSLSVRKQMVKIERLNKFIATSNAFKKAPKGNLIILPTGDGVAIGFLLNPELPLELAIELHRLLRPYNQGKSDEERLGVRIGLASGPVFTVTDVNNVKNVWGPGIILARRVMDAGNEGHILLADKLAEDLIALKDYYRSTIKPVSQEFEIKHGQKIKLYSAFSEEFGNPEIPPRIIPS